MRKWCKYLIRKPYCRQDIKKLKTIRSPIKDIQTAAKDEGQIGLKHPAIPLPDDLYPLRRTQRFDLNNDQPLAALDTTTQKLRSHIWKKCAFTWI